MREPLTVVAAQPRCVSHDVEANAMTHAAVIRAANGHVVIFPELSMTGYELDAEAITVDDSRLTPIVDACAGMGSLALIGAPVDAGRGRPEIAMLGVDGAGATVAYSKIWLHGSEAERFSPGTKPALVEVRGWRLGLAICRDTGVPRHAADTAALGIDAYVAGRHAARGPGVSRGRPCTPHRDRSRDLGGRGELRGPNRWGLRAHRWTVRDMDARWGRRRQGRARARGDRTRDARVI
jgi:predicted amidohydrolase